MVNQIKMLGSEGIVLVFTITILFKNSIFKVKQ